MIFKICFLLLFSVSIISGNELPEEFTKLLDKCNLTFNEPGEIELVPVVNDTLFEHSIRYLSEKNNIELKIQILPLDTADKYKDPKIFMASKDGSYEDSDIITEPFNSDKAALAGFDFKEGFYNNKHKHCLIIWLHKNKRAGIYICLTGSDRLTMLQFSKKYLLKKDKVILKFNS